MTKSGEEKTKSRRTPNRPGLVWVVGVDFSMLLLGVAIVLAAVRLKPGDDESRVEDIALVTIQTDLGQCHDAQWRIVPKKGSRLIFQEPVGLINATMPTVVGLDNVDDAKVEIYLLTKPNAGSCGDASVYARAKQFISDYKNEQLFNVLTKDEYETFCREFYWLCKQRSAMPPNSAPIEEKGPKRDYFQWMVNKLKSDDGIGRSNRLWIYGCLSHIKQRYDSVYRDPLGFKGSPSRVAKELLTFQKSIELWRTNNTESAPPLAEQFIRLIASDELKGDPLLLTLAIDYAAAIEPKDEVSVTITSRSAGDSLVDSSAGVTSPTMETKACGKISMKEFIDLHQNKNSCVVTIFFSYKKPSTIAWKNFQTATCE